MSSEEEGSENSKIENLVPSIYSELRRIARLKIANEGPQTLSATSLVHEAWLRLRDANNGIEGKWNNRRHFFGAAAEAMRRILIDRARAKQAIKRGGDLERDDLAITQIAAPIENDDSKTLALCEALERFSEVDPECAEIVQLKFFAGFNWDEIATNLESSERTVRRRWTYAKAWLRDAMNPVG
ncbi:MAG: ECF-type sigma factor [Verrucomicrobiota bacterium]